MTVIHRGDGFGRVYRADGVYAGLVYRSGDFWRGEDRAGEWFVRATEAAVTDELHARARRLGKERAA